MLLFVFAIVCEVLKWSLALVLILPLSLQPKTDRVNEDVLSFFGVNSKEYNSLIMAPSRV